MNIAIRITNSFQELEAFCVRLRSQTDRIVIYEHSASRVHIHGLLINCKVSTDTIKNYVKSCLGVTTYPKSDWSFKTIHKGNPVDDNFIVYMSKGTLEPVYCSGYDTATIEQYKQQWVDMPRERKREMVQYKLKYENPREAKVRQNELMDMVKRQCIEQKARTPREILEIIRDVVYIQHKTIVGRYKIRDFYDYIVADIKKDSWLDNMEKLISYREI